MGCRSLSSIPISNTSLIAGVRMSNSAIPFMKLIDMGSIGLMCTTQTHKSLFTETLSLRSCP